MKFCSNQDCDHLVRHGKIAEFLDSAQVCSDCGARLREGAAPAPVNVSFQDLQTVYQAANVIQAHLIRDILESDGIPVHLGGESLTGAVGELPATVLQIEVQVPPEFALRARKLALQFEAGGITGAVPS
jgi:hypothetical protein